MNGDRYNEEMHALRHAYVDVLAAMERLRDRSVNIHLWNRFEAAEVACRTALALMPRIDGKDAEMEIA